MIWMTGISVDIIFNESFYRKVDAPWIEIFNQIIRDVTLEAEARCIRLAPVLTGALRRGHSSDLSKDLTGYIRNSMHYWIYVVYGTKYQSANPYTQRVCDSLASEKWASNRAKMILKNYGVLE